MNKRSKYYCKDKYINTDVTLEEVLQFIKDELKKGRLTQFKFCNEVELLELAKASKPLIQVKLEMANYLAKKQLINRKVKPLKMLS